MSTVIFWFRRDLRLYDNAGLYHALKSGYPVLPIFIFDQEILEKLEDKDDSRVTFIYQQIHRLQGELEEKGSSLLAKYGKPREVIEDILKEYTVKAVYTNQDYEPYAYDRDSQVSKLLHTKGIAFHTFKDQVIFIIRMRF